MNVSEYFDAVCGRYAVCLVFILGVWVYLAFSCVYVSLAIERSWYMIEHRSLIYLDLCLLVYLSCIEIILLIHVYALGSIFAIRCVN